MSTNTTGQARNLSQEQLRNARRVLKRMQSNGYLPHPDELPDLGGLQKIFPDLINAKAKGGQEGLTSALEALRPDFPILDELRKPSRYAPLSVSALLRMPPQEWLVRNFLYEDAITVIYGPPGSAKSFIALDWAICLALGREWKGRAVKRCRVFYLAAEGVRGYQRRLQAWSVHHELDPSKLEGYLSFIPCAVPLLNTAEVSEFIEALQAYVEEQADDLPTVIVLDTVFQCAAGQNINTPEVMSGLIAAVQQIKDGTKATHILLVHHSGKDRERGMFGSTALNAGADCAYAVEKDRDNLITLASSKIKDDEDIQVYLALQQVIYGVGERDHSCVIVSREKPVQQLRLTATQHAMLEVLPEDGPGLRFTDWKKVYDAARDRGAAKQTFIDNMKKLLSMGVIEKISTESGTDRESYRRKVKLEATDEDSNDA